MKTRTKQILKTMNIIVWIIFIGLCIQTGTILYSFIFSLFTNPVGANNHLYLGLEVSELIKYNKEHYILMLFLSTILSGLKAYLFFKIIKITSKISLIHPFSSDVAKMILRTSYVAAEIGIVAMIAKTYYKWLLQNGITLSNLTEYISGGPEFLFMAGIIFVIAQVFKRGIEIQSENELTI